MSRHHTFILIGICICALSHAYAIPPLEQIPDAIMEMRDPLLPVDYEAPKEEEVDAEAEQRLALQEQITWPQLQLRGITHAGRQKYFAIIDRIGIVEEGDTITLREGNLIYAWRIDSISEEGITTTRLHVTSMEDPDNPVRIMDRATMPRQSP